MRFLTFLIGCVYSGCTQANITELQSLNFGTIALVDNSSVGDIIVDKFGNVTSTSHFRVVIPPQPAHFLIDGLAPNTGVSIAISHSATQMSPLTSSPETLTFSLIESAEYVVADANGEAEIKIGAKLSTSGNGSLNFAQTDYRINYQVTFLY
uniref:DUF4402 domain-containing protein n=1 Tax=Ningiella ruwaisensis TaxID=2364274 RepID=UPI001F501ED6|nr:DUF4402 domain-containing protein [Ningiella ruwaisensis]